MKREFLKELELEDETINKIMAEHGKSVNDYKQKAEKVDTLESQIQDYDQQIKDRDQQLKDLGEKAKGNENLEQQIKELQQQNTDAQKEWEQKLNDQKKEAKLELALKDADAKNPKAVKALLNNDAVTLDGENLIGLDEQLKNLKESDGYLFGETQPAGLQGRDPVPGQGDPKGKVKNPFTKENFNMTEQGQLVRNDPDEARKLITQAGGDPAKYGL